MRFALNYFSVALILSAIVSGIVAFISYRRRAVTGAATMMWLMIALTFWSVVYAIENLSPALGWHKFWSAAQYLSVAAIPVLWLVFAIQYSQQEKAPGWKKLIWLGILPVITVLMAWTNDFHQLVWPHMELVNLQGITLLKVEHGIYFWVQAVYAYSTILAGTVIFVRQAMRASDMYRSQAYTMLLAATFLLFGNGLYVFDLLPFKGLDITPFTFTISCLILAWGLFRHRLLDLMPIASEIVLSSLGDGIMVTDASMRVVFMNPAFEALAGLMPGTSVGHPVNEVLYNWPNIFREYRERTLTEIELGAGAHKMFLEVQISPLFKRQAFIGCIYDLRNITDRVDTESKTRLLRQSITQEIPGEYTPIMLALRAKDGKVLDVNNEYVFHTGYTREETVGRTALQIGLWDVETRSRLTRQLHENNQITDADITVKTKSGQSQRWKLSISKTAIDCDELHTWIAKPHGTDEP